MGIINKFKVNYNIKLLDDLVLNNKKSEILSFLKKIKAKDSEMYFLTFLHFLNSYKNNSIKEHLLNNKIILINSFEIEDSNYLSNFFSFYFDNCKFNYEQDRLSNAIANDLESLKLSNVPKKVDFENFIQLSEFFFSSLLINDEEKNIFLKSSSAFFEAGEKSFFIYPETTAAFFLIHQNPLQTYASLKKKFSSSQEALNVMFNFKDTSVSNQNIDSKYNVLENRQSWNIYLNSWKDPNVVNTYRGLLIPQRDFWQKPKEILTKTLFHLIDAGLKIHIDYNLIDEYVNNNSIEKDDISAQFSNKEKKILLNNLDSKLLSYFNYQI